MLACALCLALSGSVAEAAGTSKIDKLVKGMSLEEKVGQLFLASCPANGAQAAKAYRPGGYLLFAQNFENQTPASVKKTIQGYQKASKIPMLIAVDEEGGSITRVSRFKAFRSSPFASPRSVYAAGGWDAVKKDARAKAKLLLPLGVNVNLAPVADLPVSKSDFIYGRSFGTDPKLTSKYVSTVVKESRAAGLGTALKHFPGYGNNPDTHTGSAVDERPLSTFKTRDFLPFKAGIQAGADAVLVSHNIIKNSDPNKPASLSKKVYGALRGLGFEGVALTDDLTMGAIAKKYGQGEAAALAIQAGADMLIASDFQSGISAVLAAVRSGRISESRIDQSVRRILTWKHRLGLI